jgi:hypothetical protein
VAATVLVAPEVHAQGAEASASASIGEGGAASLPTAEAVGDTDHDRFVGSFAVGYFGPRAVPIATDPKVSQTNGILQMDARMGEVNAPVIGVRYWFTEALGVDFGFGFRKHSSTVTWSKADYNVPGSPPPGEYEHKEDRVNQTAVLVHAGLPIALSIEKHFVFEVVPEANIGFSSGTIKHQPEQPPSMAARPIADGDIKLSGFQMDLGARVGAEVHFGFVGLPNLALQASVGLYLSMAKIKADGGSRAPRSPANPSDERPKTTYQQSSTTITTSVNGQPWGIFENSVSALYYF